MKKTPIFLSNFLALFVLSLLVSCGGGGSDGVKIDIDKDKDDSSTKKTLILKVGNFSLDSHSTVSRVTTIISGNKKEITILSANKPSAISLSGGLDVSLFEIIDVNNVKKLSFKTLPDRFNPADSNADGVYEVDIQAKDEDGQIAKYEAAYKIIIPKNAKDILLGKTFYTSLSNNEYSKVTYSKTSKVTTRYNSSGKIANSQKVKNINYDGLSFSFNDDKNIRITCLVSEKPKVNLSCEDEGKTKSYDVSYLTNAPTFIIPESYKLEASAQQIVNLSTLDSIFLPKIKSFSVKGNKAIKNNKVVISKSSYQGQFSIKLSLTKKTNFEQKVWIGLNNANESIVITMKSGVSNEKVSCVYKSYNGNNGGINYTCDNIEQANTTGSNDTEMLMLVCDKPPKSGSNAICNTALLPVLFVD